MARCAWRRADRENLMTADAGEVEVRRDGPVLIITIAENGPLAIATSKRVVRESQDWTAADMFRRQREITAPLFTSRDAAKARQPSRKSGSRSGSASRCGARL